MTKETCLISWRLYPDFDLNARFLEEVKPHLPDHDAPVFVLCKSGGRSREAAQAMTRAGYRQVFNILSGFEGNSNEAGRQGVPDGWKAAMLPWRQA